MRHSGGNREPLQASSQAFQWPPAALGISVLGRSDDHRQRCFDVHRLSRFVRRDWILYRRIIEGERSDEGQDETTAFGDGTKTRQEKSSKTGRGAVHHAMGSGHPGSRSKPRPEHAYRCNRELYGTSERTRTAALQPRTGRSLNALIRSTRRRVVV